MFENDTYLETVMARYKLGLDQVQATQQISHMVSLQPSWIDRLLYSLGKTLICIGSRLQHRNNVGAQKTYHPAFPAG